MKDLIDSRDQLKWKRKAELTERFCSRSVNRTVFWKFDYDVPRF
jgi:hypothetical protein